MTAYTTTHAIFAPLRAEVLKSYGNVDLAEAKRQQDALVRLLTELDINVIVAPNATCTESPFMGNAAFILNGTALMSRSENSKRQSDINKTHDFLKKTLAVNTVHTLNPGAKLDAGDILFTGREFFVGMSKWSNLAGAKAIAETFPEYPCCPIKMPQNGAKLEKFLTFGGPDVLCVGTTDDAQDVLHRLERGASFDSYLTLTVPEIEAANCLFINGTLIHRAIEEIPNSFQDFCEKVDYSRRSVCFSELSKVSAGLTSSCLLKREAH